MIELKLNNFGSTLIDEEDYEKVSKFKWRNKRGYVVRNYYNEEGKNKTVYLHRVILNCPENLFVDHINGNKSDNRKSNLRIVTKRQNSINVPKYKDKTSKYKGVSWHAERNKFRAVIMINGKSKHLGYFENELDGAKKYNEVAKELFGEYANLNKLEE